MLGLSLPYCLASPLMGYFTDKYPVSIKATKNDYMEIILSQLYVCHVKQNPPFVGVCQATRSWFMVTGAVATAFGFFLLGPVPFLHIPK